MGVNVIRTPVSADYGRDPAGADIARNEWWDRANQNDPQQAAVESAQTWANKQSTGAGARPGATEDSRLANNVAGGANGNQAGAVGLARSMASGMGPSEAAYQLQSGLDQGLRQQTAIGRSARGGAALATAGANAGYNRATMQQNAFTQGGLLRSRDMAAGAGMYGALAGQQREQATARLGQANEMGQFNAQQNDKYGLQMGQTALGLGEVANQHSQLDLGDYQQGMNPINAQTQARQGQKGWNVANQKTAIAANIEEDG